MHCYIKGVDFKKGENNRHSFNLVEYSPNFSDEIDAKKSYFY